MSPYDDLHWTDRRRRNMNYDKRFWIAFVVLVSLIVIGFTALVVAAGGTKSVEYSFSDPSGIDAVEIQACCDGDVQPVSRVEFDGEAVAEGKCSIIWQNYGSVSVKVRAIDNSPKHNPTEWQELIGEIEDTEAPDTIYVRWGE